MLGRFGVLVEVVSILILGFIWTSFIYNVAKGTDPIWSIGLPLVISIIYSAIRWVITASPVPFSRPQNSNNDDHS